MALKSNRPFASIAGITTWPSPWSPVTNRAPNGVMGDFVLDALTLSGCGTAGPGVAAKVGDQTVTSADVNRLSEGYCRAFEPQISAQGQAVPMRLIAVKSFTGSYGILVVRFGPIAISPPEPSAMV